MASMASPWLGTHYPAGIPVAIKLVGAVATEPCVSIRSENLTEKGILRYNDSLIPEGSSIELTVDGTPEPLVLTIHGKVLREDLHPYGKFAITLHGDFPFLSFIGKWQELGRL